MEKFVSCVTRDQCFAVIRRMEAEGCRPINPDHAWRSYSKEVVIRKNNDKHISYANRQWYTDHGYGGRIITAHQYLNRTNKPILITRKGRVVTAENKNTGEKAIATCSPTDTFDFGTGAMIAVARLIAQSDKGITKDAEAVLRQLLGDDVNSDAPTEENPTTKFKVGDLVTLKDGLEPGKTYGNMTLYTGNMFDSLNGEPEKVIEVYKRGKESPSYQTASGWYYSEEMLELWDENKIREGDKVHVKKGRTNDRYDTYYKWLKDNISDVDLLLGFERSDAISTTDTYTVVKIAPHEHFVGLQLAFIKRTNGIDDTFSYLYDVDALEKVTE